MHKAPLLELNGVEVAINVTKNAIIDVLDKRAKLGMKDMYDEVRTLMSFLNVKEGLCDFWPSRIGSHSNKKVTTTKIPVDGQGILTELLHVTCATRKG